MLIYFPSYQVATYTNDAIPGLEPHATPGGDPNYPDTKNLEKHYGFPFAGFGRLVHVGSFSGS